ncbi:alkaline phosphatase D family protein [Luteipulveratus mongoliensis]|uniref:Alkaline phosphatase n=1 Tax=Luteipulveratus mongoliensis TaxID=571913 RepID=A0A0K1JKL2_9MICO|nr:alkaline phosphatase D family protein [Luteipulveratus mongoliensis]AKU17254.1 alkaline phosphatase [Luteipulveratus mongoliensis]
MDVSRRSLLIGALGTGIAAVPLIAEASPLRVSARTDPFTLGVASGDPTADGVVLWTRLALNPLDESGLGGMPNRPVSVRYEVADDEKFRRVVRRGAQVARPESAHSVHVELSGLRPGREYYYRFRVGTHVSPAGRTVLAPAGHELASGLSMAFASCSQLEHGWFTAYRRMAEDQPDLVLHLGDYQYEYKAGAYEGRGGNVRDHAGPETVDLASYRLRHAQYKNDPDLQAAHAIAPWLVVFDDHEVDNNWADEVPENTKADEWNDTAARFRVRRAAAFKAYYENMPLRHSSIPNGPDMQIYRRLQWGRLASFHMMDTRQYRDDQACGDSWQKNCDARLDESRTITGPRQERWLLEGFKASRARWDILGQQVFFAEKDRNASADITDVSMDGWDGYAASRRRITQGWVDARVRNPIVLTGDVHRNWANDLKVDYRDPSAPVVGSELVCTSITSTGDGDGSTVEPTMPTNPHLKFYSDDRGYVRTRITPGAMRADFRVIDSVATQGGSVSTKASYQVLDGQRGLQRAL